MGDSLFSLIFIFESLLESRCHESKELETKNNLRKIGEENLDFIRMKVLDAILIASRRFEFIFDERQHCGKFFL